ncbi:GNAT family N-acetyltransferase [Micromonospora carbonacea]|uniref:GNAT family N-acetyltransferase n=1 Tax=Micromonospora carbonacea TaxID=47853 RepID=UPI003319146C
MPGLRGITPACAGTHFLNWTAKDQTDAVGRGECHVAVDGFRIAAMAVVDELADPEFWREEDDPRDALYVHRVIVDRGYAGRGLGEALVDFAAKLAADRGKSWLRLDAWRTNLALHGYYRRQGFDHVPTVSLPHRESGVLFQRRAGEASRGTVRFERMSVWARRGKSWGRAVRWTGRADDGAQRAGRVRAHQAR